MANKDFVVKNGLVVNTSFSANSSGLYFSNTLTVNTTTFIGTANNSSYLGGLIASGYQTTAGLSANIATITANNTSFVGSVSAANVVSNAQLSSNLANYQTLAGLGANVAAYLPTYTGVANGSSFTVGTSTIANSTGVYTGVVNAASYTVGSGFVANATGVTANSLTVSTNTVTIGSALTIVANGFIGLGSNTTPGAPISWSGNSNNSVGYINMTNSNTGSNAYSGISIATGGVNAILYSNPSYGTFVGSTTNNQFSFLANNTVHASVQPNGDFYLNSGYGGSARTFGVRAWINFYDNAVRNSGNMAGISKQSTGYFIVFIDTDMPDGNYSAIANYCRYNTNTGDNNDGQAMCWDYNSAYVRVTVCKGDGVIVDPSAFCSVTIVR